MSLYEKLTKKEENLSLVGLGYVGMPIAVAFAKKGVNVIGFDLNKSKIDLYKSGIDPTLEVGNEVIKNTTVEFTSDEADLSRAGNGPKTKINQIYRPERPKPQNFGRKSDFFVS